MSPDPALPFFLSLWKLFITLFKALAHFFHLLPSHPLSVYAFGVLLWMLFTFDLPYRNRGITTPSSFVRLVSGGVRPMIPPAVPDVRAPPPPSPSPRPPPPTHVCRITSYGFDVPVS